MARQTLNLGTPIRGVDQPGGESRYESFRKTDENFAELYAGTVSSAAKTANYTLVLSDVGTAIDFNSATGLTLTVPAHATAAFPNGTVLEVARLGAGAVSIAGPINYAQWNSAANFTITNSGTTATRSSGTGDVLVRANSGSTTGKSYWEGTISGTWPSPRTAMGFSNSSATALGIGDDGTQGVYIYRNGAIWAGGATSVNTGITFDALPSGARMDMALDMDNYRAWFRLNGGSWNTNASHNPATNTGGIDISASAAGNTMYPTFMAGTTDAMTANFGATTFAGTVPSGFGGTGGGAVTLRTPSSLTLRVQNSTATLRKLSANEWLVGGDLT